MKFLPSFLGQCLFDIDAHQRRGNQRGDGHCPENRVPAEYGHQQTTEHRCQQRRNRHHQHHKRHHSREFIFGEHIAHQRVDDHTCGSGCQTVQETHPDQLLDRLRQRTGTGRDGKDHHAPEDNRLTPEAVRHRSVKQLPYCKTQHVSAERHLHAARRNAIFLCDHGHTWQIHIDGQRHQHRYQSQDENQSDVGDRFFLHFQLLQLSKKLSRRNANAGHFLLS